MGTIPLNENLQPVNSPITNRNDPKTGYDFSYQNQRDSISTMHIKNFSFNQGTGGTLVLGGSGNGNGLLKIKDSSGNVIVTGDNTGLTIDGGNIVVKNADNTTIIDTSGIVSSANFITDQVFSNTPNSTTGTVYTDLPGASLAPFVLDRSAILLISVNTTGYNAQRALDGTTSANVQVTDSIDGGLISYTHYGNWILTSIDFVGFSYGMDVSGDNVTLSAYQALSAGTHTLKIQYKATTSGTAIIADYLLNYTILGS